MRIKYSFIIVVISILFVACDTKESINISGSTTVLPVLSDAAEQFKKNNPNTVIIVNSGGSGIGIHQLGAGKVHIGMTSRNITYEEMEQHPGVEFNPISIGRDAVVPVVSSEIYESGVQALTMDQIAKIYKGEIVNWSEVGGPDKEIFCVDKEKSRGTRHVFMEAIMGDKTADAPGADLVVGSNNEEQLAIEESDAAIGMLSNAWLSKDVKGVSVIMPDGHTVEPSLEKIEKKEFPITRDLFIVVNGEPEGITKNFIDYILSDEGQEIVKEAGYISVKKVKRD
ncbi:solute-binding protein [Flavobacteriaceae bacterium R38]|nr:solute-binding protein [Flavobacteriaceae bacterium R38]